MRCAGLVLLIVGCAPAAPKPLLSGRAAVPSASASSKVTSAAQPVVPTKLDLFLFPDGFEPRDVRDVGDEQLFVGIGGERWLVGKSKLEPAKQLAPEALVAARASAEGWVFLGQSGAVYTSKTPLGPFVSQRPPPEPFRVVAAGKEAFVAITRAGDALRSTDRGATWKKTQLPNATSHLALAANGEGLALAVPGVLATTDDGASWRTIPSPIGAVRVRTGTGDALVAEGSGIVTTKTATRWGLRSAVFEAGKLVVEEGNPKRLSLPHDGPPLAHAEAVSDGRAALAGTRMIEPWLDNGGEVPAWRVSTYELGTAPTSGPLPLPASCYEAFASASAASAIVGCMRDPDPEKTNDKPALVVARSVDLGKTWSSDPIVEAPAPIKRLHAIGKTGLLLETDTGAFVRRGDKLVPIDFKLGKDEEPPVLQQVASSDDGLRVHAVASRIVDDERRLVLLVSKDGGRSFVTRRIPDPEPDSPLVDDALAMTFDGNGTVAIVPYGGGVARVATKDDGGTFEIARSPIDPSYVSLAGDRGLAVDANDGWETIDGGRTWTQVSLPAPRFPGRITAIACATTGCVLGDRGVRLGWEVNGAGDVKPYAPPPPKTKTKPPAPRPIACTTIGKPVPLNGVDHLQATDRFLFGTQRPAGTGATMPVDVVLFEPDASGPRTRTVRLLNLRKPAANAVLHLAATREGVFAARAIEPSGPTDVEVAVFVAATGQVVTAVLPKALKFAPGKTPRIDLQAIFVPGFGAWIRAPDRWFGVSTNKLTTIPRPEGLPTGIGFGAVHVGSRSILFATQTTGHNGLAALTFVLDDAGKSLGTELFGLAPDGAGPTTATFALSGSAPNIVATTAESELLPARAFALRLDGTGADPLLLPTAVEANACKKDTGLTWNVPSPFAVTVDGRARSGATLSVRDSACVATAIVRGTEPLLAIPGHLGVDARRVGKQVEIAAITCP